MVSSWQIGRDGELVDVAGYAYSLVCIILGFEIPANSRHAPTVLPVSAMFGGGLPHRFFRSCYVYDRGLL